MRSDEGSVGVNGPDAIAISIGGKARIVAAAANGFAQRRNMGFDWFRMDAAEERVAGAANLLTGNAMAPHQGNQQPAGGAVHRIDDEAQPRGLQLFPIDQLIDGIQIRRKEVEGLNLSRP